MSANRQWAKQRLDRYRADDRPYLIAYFADDRLLFYSMNLAAVRLFGCPDGEKESFLAQRQDIDVGLLVKGSNYQQMIACTSDDFAVELACYKGKKRVRIEPYCSEEGVIFKVVGKSFKAPNILGSHQKINDLLKGWIEVFKTTRGILVAGSSILLGLLGITIAPWASFEPVAVQAAKDDTKEKVEQIILDEIDLLPRHSNRVDHNGITVSKYLDNLESRQLYAGEIKGLGVLDQKALDIKSTKEDGWYQQLQTHFGDEKNPAGALHVINKADFEKKSPNHGIVIALNSGGAEQLLSYPIRKNERLVGYVAIGLRKPATPRQLILIENRLKAISLKIELGTNFPG